MKKGILLLTLAAGCYFGLNSFDNGSAANGYDCTGAETGLGNPTGCAVGMGTGCHATFAHPGVELKLKVDSAGSPINFYTPGKTYTVTVTGTHHVLGASLPKFGFQVGVINGSEPNPMAVNAGALQSSYLPFGVRYKAGNLANYRVNIVEHVFPIMATTGAGDTGSTYVESFTWTAPLVGADTVSVWGVLLAANANTTATGDYWDTTHIMITRRPVPAAVGSVSSVFSIKAACNPVYNTLDLLLAGAESGLYQVCVYDMLGKKVASEQVLVGSLSNKLSIDASEWMPGLYVAVVDNGEGRNTVQVIKN
jgi:hypothetical protein